MKAAIVNPYLDTLGGGERYTLSFAKVLQSKGYRVDVQWEDASLKERLEKRFGLDLKKLNFVDDVGRGDGYDVCFWVSNGSIPLLRSRNNILHFQVPFKDVNGRTLLNKMKLYRINKVVCNSYFTKKYIDREYGVDSLVIYPPVAVEEFHPRKKENVILFVGRFSELKQIKGQEVLVEAFKRLKPLRNWRLILAGGVEVGSKDLLGALERRKGDHLEIIKSPSFSELVKLYAKAKIFWSAAGFGVDEKKNPEKMEHFGITCVEAMASGCVLVIFAGGGHREIVADKENGRLWKTKRELIRITRDLMKDSKLLKSLAEEAEETSRFYENERFEIQVSEII